jgi:hypothetical protein
MPTLKEKIIETFHLDQANVDDVIEAIKKLVHEGMVRRITVKDEKGDTFAEFPLGVGVVAVALMPIWAALAAIAAIAADYTVQVELAERET